jgi:hypothetical protein
MNELLALSLALVVSLAFYTRGNKKARSLVETWAAAQGLELLSCSQSLFGGSFWWKRSKVQRVYRVSVRDSSNRIRRADVKCGGALTGMFSDKLDVRWLDGDERR